MRFSKDVLIVETLAKYDSLKPSERASIPLEACILACGIDVQALLNAIMIELRNYSASIVKAKAFSSHPEIMQTTIDRANGPTGFQDRKLIHTALGFLPQPKGTTFIGNLKLNKGIGDSESAGELEENADDIDIDYVFPDINLTQERLGSGTKLLSDGGNSSEEEELAELEARLNGE